MWWRLYNWTKARSKQDPEILGGGVQEGETGQDLGGWVGVGWGQGLQNHDSDEA